MKLNPIAFVVGSMALCGTALPSHAESYPASNWLPPANYVSIYGYDKLSEEMDKATNGKVKFQVYHSASLLPAKTTLQGVADGAAVVGPVFPGYTPAEVPLNFLMNDTSFIIKDFFAAALAYTDLATSNPRIMGEWRDHGVLFGGAYATAIFGYACMKQATTKEELGSLKIRSAGGAQAEWVKSLGAVPVAVPITDVFSGLERGSIDCVLTDPTNIDVGNQFGQVVKSFVTLPLGSAIGANWVYNLNFWRGLEPSERRALLDNMGKAIVDIEVSYVKGVDNSKTWMKDHDIPVLEPSKGLTDETDAFKAQFIANLAKLAADDRHIENPGELIQAFVDKQAKWTKLLEGVDRTDNEALYAIVHDNLYGKIDENTFGMN
jgi:TRAP-type C4-dicarboxylate transport system substrate-binding protein